MTAPQNGENPLYTNGKNTRKTETIETPRHNADFSPFFPPTSHRLNMNISTKQMIGIVLSRLETVTTLLSPLPLTIAMTDIPLRQTAPKSVPLGLVASTVCPFSSPLFMYSITR